MIPTSGHTNPKEGNKENHKTITTNHGDSDMAPLICNILSRECDTAQSSR